MNQPVQEVYGNRVRVRVCGILIENQSVLLVNHRSLSAGDFWAPPGGGMDFGESAANCLVREVKEETGLDIEVAGFLFATEFVKPPLHAVELFFLVHRLSGKLEVGSDPEMKPADQLITDVRFWSWKDIAAIPPNGLHGLFRLVKNPSQITDLKGYFSL